MCAQQRERAWLVETNDVIPVHRRAITIEAYEAGDEFEVIGWLEDTRPWADDVDKVRTVHAMGLRIAVDRKTLTITDARADMERFPHAECPSITAAFAALVGLSVARGYTREVQNRFGRVKGCSHLEFLARALGPVVVQAIPSSASRRLDGEALGKSVAEGTAWLGDTCHIWASDGPGSQKIALGWRPGKTGYPAPPVAEVAKLAASAPE